MRKFLLGIATIAACGGCDDVTLDDRTSTVAGVLARADEPLLRSRPGLVEGKYARMRSGPYELFRGSVPLFKADWAAGTAGVSRSRFHVARPLVHGLGDPHPENFGTLRAGDGSLAIEPNDLDGADRLPYLWDLRRLTVGVALAATLANADDAAARERSRAARRAIARGAALAYARTMIALAAGAPAPRATRGAGGPIADDLFKRAERDGPARRELADGTVMEGGARRLRRGVLDPADPTQLYVDAPETVRAAIPAALAAYRTSLAAPPPPEDLAVLDVVRELGSGVASWARVRLIVLVRGPSDAPEDDRVLEVKELADSGTAIPIGPYLHSDTVQERVTRAARGAWARPDADPTWGSASLLGLAVQVRAETSWHRTVRVSRMVGARGTPEAIAAIAELEAAVLARAHAATDAGEPDPTPAIAAAIGADVEGFADEQADVAEAYAALALDDAWRFGLALDALGPRLGVPIAAEDRARPDTAALWGAP